jgi:hypothetical protein
MAGKKYGGSWYFLSNIAWLALMLRGRCSQPAHLLFGLINSEPPSRILRLIWRIRQGKRCGDKQQFQRNIQLATTPKAPHHPVREPGTFGVMRAPISG